MTASLSIIHLWYLILCIPKLVLEGQILPQWSHGIDIPSKWLDSMWFFIWVNAPSLPHILQMDDLACIGVQTAESVALMVCEQACNDQSCKDLCKGVELLVVVKEIINEPVLVIRLWFVSKSFDANRRVPYSSKRYQIVWFYITSHRKNHLKSPTLYSNIPRITSSTFVVLVYELFVFAVEQIICKNKLTS